MKVILKLILNVKNVKNYKQEIRQENEKAKILAKFENSSKSLKYLLNIQKPFNDKIGLGFNANDPSTSKLRQIKFVKPSREI